MIKHWAVSLWYRRLQINKINVYLDGSTVSSITCIGTSTKSYLVLLSRTRLENPETNLSGNWTLGKAGVGVLVALNNIVRRWWRWRCVLPGSHESSINRAIGLEWRNAIVIMGFVVVLATVVFPACQKCAMVEYGDWSGWSSARLDASRGWPPGFIVFRFPSNACVACRRLLVLILALSAWLIHLVYRFLDFYVPVFRLCILGHLLRTHELEIFQDLKDV